MPLAMQTVKVFKHWFGITHKYTIFYSTFALYAVDYLRHCLNYFSMERCIIIEQLHSVLNIDKFTELRLFHVLFLVIILNNLEQSSVKREMPF